MYINKVLYIYTIKTNTNKMKTNINLNPYNIHWGLAITKENFLNMKETIFAPSKDALLKKLEDKKGRYFIITDKQFGLIQNAWDGQELTPNTTLEVHLKVKNNVGCTSLIPMTSRQFNNPIIK